MAQARLARLGHALNHTAARVWALLDGTRTTAAVAQDLVTTYALSAPQALTDVEELVDELHQARLVVIE